MTPLSDVPRTKAACGGCKDGDHAEHLFMSGSNTDIDEVMVVGSGPDAYLWLGREGRCVGWITKLAALQPIVASLQNTLKKKKKKTATKQKTVHYVTEAVFARSEPVPPICGNTKARAVTRSRKGITCTKCLKALKNEQPRNRK